MDTVTPHQKLPATCDVAIIGAGIAGLTAGALLSKAGLQVLVLEAAAHPGGYLAGFEREGFQFDSSIQWLNQCHPGGFVHRIFTHIGPGHPPCRSLSRIRRYKGDSFEYLLTTHPYQMQEQLIRDFPDEQSGICKLFEDGKKLGRKLPVLTDRMRTPETMSLREKSILGLKMLRWVIPIRKFFTSSFDKALGRYFKGDDIKKVFLSDDSLMSILVPISWAFSGDFQGPPVGGSMAFVNWLLQQISSCGSQVIPNRRVEKVLLNNKKATGVKLESGEKITARYVLAACDVETLYEKMLPDGQVSESLLKRLRAADLYYSTLSIFLGLDCNVECLGFNEEVLNLTNDHIARHRQSSGDPHQTSLTVIAPSFRDPTLAPEGKGTLSIHCQAYLDYGDYWKTEPGLERGAAYRDFKKHYADIVIARLEQMLGREIRSHILVQNIATPITYWRYTRNRAGSVMGAMPTPKNIRSKIAHYKTPVPNLFLGGHWAEYGGGVPVATKAATNASLLILQDCNPKEFNRLKDCVDGNSVEDRRD